MWPAPSAAPEAAPGGGVSGSRAVRRPSPVRRSSATPERDPQGAGPGPLCGSAVQPARCGVLCCTARAHSRYARAAVAEMGHARAPFSAPPAGGVHSPTCQCTLVNTTTSPVTCDRVIDGPAGDGWGMQVLCGQAPAARRPHAHRTARVHAH